MPNITTNSFTKLSISPSRLLLVLLAALALAPSAQATNLIQNANFEALIANPTLTASGKGGKASNLQFWTCGGPNGCALAYVLFSNTSGSAWNLDRGLHGTVPNSPLGGNFVAIDGDTRYLAGISQSISGLTIGSNYVLSFYMAAAQQRGLSGATTEWWDVSFGSRTIRSTVLNNPSQGVQPWRLETIIFQASAVTQTLTFLAGGTPNGLPPISLLDGLSLVQQSPEPGTMLMLAGGLAALVALRKKRSA